MVELPGSSRLRRAGALALPALAGGCGSVEDDEPGQLGRAAQPIYNAGDGLAADDTGAHPQAVWVKRSDNAVGSAFLVASNVVLTAAHATCRGMIATMCLRVRGRQRPARRASAVSARTRSGLPAALPTAPPLAGRRPAAGRRVVGQTALALRLVGALGVLGSTLLLLGGCSSSESELECMPAMRNSPAVVVGAGSCPTERFTCDEGLGGCTTCWLCTREGGTCTIDVTVGSAHYSTEIELVWTSRCMCEFSPPGDFATIRLGEECPSQ
ncbi:MAG: hypothetical protein HY744_10280 [Deltaproteobacteria bacterium]|nr:hypothetical protein [Deltaproteobacteria bacterium]